MSCAGLANGILKTCDGVKRVGGNKNYFYLGNGDELTSYTQDGTTKDIEVLTLGASKYLYKFEGLEYLNACGQELEKGTIVNQYKHYVDFVILTSTSLEHERVESLLASKNLYAIVPGADERFEVLGLDVTGGSASNPMAVLEAETATYDSGKALNERTHFVVRLSGKCQGTSRFIVDATTPTYDATKTYLDGLLS